MLLLLEINGVELLGDEQRKDGRAIFHSYGDEAALRGRDGQHVIDVGIKLVGVAAESPGTCRIERGIKLVGGPEWTAAGGKEVVDTGADSNC